VVLVKFPELAVDHVEMLIGEVVSNFIDIFFLGNLDQTREKVAVFEISPSYFPVVLPVARIEDS